ncbi:MAG: hypothetical protein P0Y49_13380 [Candidatus Pedobacter colombiensis]|uniref:Uncharacterized protein n=1 Tax=Candidatus Pedobacter colombiensis TaxID=3121371 RepID=A0AAJ6B543_9SPHI|nr:hypothetical protein [Pedobacter sp.]WEK17790.1 MAG: hypothetical protein P0Y49_13380 [Pedobacter sp.]
MSNDEQQICFYTTTYTLTTGRSLCSCKGHTYEMWVAGGCTCGDVPKQGYTTTLSYETAYDCLAVEDGGPSGGGVGGPPSGGSGQPPTGNGNGNGGGTNPDDYAPIHCNPDPNYVVPTTPPPPGQEYIIPCSEMSIPDEDIPDPNTNPQPLTSTELIIHYYNADPNTDMHLSDSEVSFLNNNSNIVEELLNYLQAETLETKEFGKWAIAYLNENTDATFSELIQANDISNSTINLPILDVSELTNYPKFKALVNDLPNFLTRYPNIL